MPEILLDPAAISRGLRRAAAEIAERDLERGVKDLIIIAIRRGGDLIAPRLATLLDEMERCAPPVGSVDITLYRDDAATALPNPRIGPSHIPGPLTGRRVLLVDDVIYTGRTIRAAIDALLDYGRPRRIELMALVDRGGRELPIQPDYRVHAAVIAPDRRVEVEAFEGELRALIVPAPREALGRESR